MDSTVLALVVTLSAVLGLLIGSFLNVVIWRVPRGESLSHPASACPGCGHTIRWYDNVPVVSWLVLRARCRDCGERISARYPLVEASTAALFGLIAYRFTTSGDVWLVPAYLYLGAVGVALAMIDVDTHRLPNRIVIPSFVVGAVLLTAGSALQQDWTPLVQAAIGAATLFAFYFVLAVAVPRGMGFGDVKLAGVIGLYLGWLGWGSLVVGAFAAFLLGGLFSIVLLALGRAKRGSGIPFGPWMLAGTGVALFFGESIADGYLALVGLV